MVRSCTAACVRRYRGQGSAGWYPWQAFAAGSGGYANGPLFYDSVGTGANTSIQGATFLSQSVSGLTDGDTYTLSLDIAAGSNDNHIGASVNENRVFSADNTSEPSTRDWA